MSAGTEATEAALKLMRLYGQKVKKRKLGIICIDGNWHGRTMGAQMMSGNKEQKKWIGYEDKNIYHIKFPYPWELEKITPKDFLNTCLKELKKKHSKVGELFFILKNLLKKSLSYANKIGYC